MPARRGARRHGCTGYDGAQVAAERVLPMAPSEAAACVLRNGDRPSFPMGLAPSNTVRRDAADAIRIEQWFFNKRTVWVTRFDLRAQAPSGTIARVMLPAGPTIGESYRRAAVEVLDYCAAQQAG